MDLEPSKGKQFKNDIEGIIEKLKKVIPETFKGVEYEVRKNEIMKLFQQRNQEIMKELNGKAKEYGFYFTATEKGLMTTPLKDGVPMSQDEYENLSSEEIENIMKKSNDLNVNTIDIIDKFRTLEEEFRKKLKKLDQNTCYDIVNFDINKIHNKYSKIKSVTRYINDLEKDIIDNIDRFKEPNEKAEAIGPLGLSVNQKGDFFNRYKVNLFVDNSMLNNAPIIDESNPTFNNLVGTIEYKNELGVLKTDFMQIKPGALHLANGGFLIIHVKIVEILYEADLWANEESCNIVGKKHIERAVKEKIYRSNKYEEKLKEMFLDGSLLIDLDGSLLIDLDGRKIGQINGLAVIGSGEYSFGKPSRITAATFSGKKGIINIEREAKQSGKIHDKGMFILSGYLGEKYAKCSPMGRTVSIGFEQNYSMIDGDSTSSTELYAILSSISEVPIKQYIAVTGSVNQKGEIQPIGGVNEKIEGFFEICKAKGLTGKQGVMIPQQNVKNLMLKEEVINAVKNKEFYIYSINTIDEGIEILTDMKTGTLGENGKYQENTINNLITKKLEDMDSN